MASDDEIDEELQTLLRQALANGLSTKATPRSAVLGDAEFVYDHAIDVAIDMSSTKAAADLMYQTMQEQNFSRQTWSEHELHPKDRNAATVNFIFTMDLLNFSFWHDNLKEPPFLVEYGEKKWSGYSSLLAVLWRALAEG